MVKKGTEVKHLYIIMLNTVQMSLSSSAKGNPPTPLRATPQLP